MPILFIFRGAGCTSCIAELTFHSTEHKFRSTEHNSSNLKTKNSPEEKAKNFARRKKLHYLCISNRKSLWQRIRLLL